MSDIIIQVEQRTATVQVDANGNEITTVTQPITVLVNGAGNVIAVEALIIEVGVGPPGPQGPQGEAGPPGIGGAEAVAAQVFYDLGQEIDSGLSAALLWSDEVFDTDNIFSVSQPTRFTCRTAGIYAFFAQVTYFPAVGSWLTEGVNELQAVSSNSGTIATSRVLITTPESGPSARQHIVNISGVIPLEVGDYIEFFFYQESGEPVTVAPGFINTHAAVVRQSSALVEGGGGTLSIYRENLLFFRESPLVNGAYLVGTHKTPSQGTVTIEHVLFEIPVATTANLTARLEVDGVLQALTVTIPAGQTRVTASPGTPVGQDKVVKWKCTAAPDSLDDAPSLVSLSTTLKIE